MSRNNRSDDRLGKPGDGRDVPRIPPQQAAGVLGTAPPHINPPTFSHPDDEPVSSEKPYGDPLIPMPMEAELAGVSGIGEPAGDLSQFRQFNQPPQQSGAPSGASEQPYRSRNIGDMQYARPDPNEDSPERDESDRDRDDLDYTDEQRLDMFRMQMFQNSLPQLPPLPGFHVCWLTTTNPRDTVRMRISLGYRLLQSSQFPGWDQHAMPGGEFAGVISVNEMVAAAVPVRLYQMYMKEAHHDAPGREEGKLRSQLQQIAASGASQNAPILMDPHTAALGLQTPRAPRFV